MGNLTRMTSFRLDPETRARLKHMADICGSMTEALRRAVRLLHYVYSYTGQDKAVIVFPQEDGSLNIWSEPFDD